MSHFFRSAAAMDTSLVAGDSHNVDKGFSRFSQIAAQRNPHRANEIRLASDRHLEESVLHVKLQETQDSRSFSHLTNENAKLKGIHVVGGWKRQPEHFVVAPCDHSIDVLQAKIREEIMYDMEENLKRKILAQEALR